MEYKLFFTEAKVAYLKEHGYTDKDLHKGWIAIIADTIEQARRYALDKYFKFWDCLYSDDQIEDYEHDLSNYPLGEIERIVL